MYFWAMLLVIPKIIKAKESMLYNELYIMLKPFAGRTHGEMKDVLLHSDLEGPEVHYYMIRGGKDKTNITIWETGLVGGEYIKT